MVSEMSSQSATSNPNELYKLIVSVVEHCNEEVSYYFQVMIDSTDQSVCPEMIWVKRMNDKCVIQHLQRGSHKILYHGAFALDQIVLMERILRALVKSTSTTVVEVISAEELFTCHHWNWYEPRLS